MEEKYKKAMVSNAQLDNEKANLIYQVDTLKDVIEEMEEQMSELRRETEEKSKVLVISKHFVENKTVLIDLTMIHQIKKHCMVQLSYCHKMLRPS